MKQEDKELLLKDLCARLPYGVVIKEECGDYINVNLYNVNLEHLIDRISEGLDKLVLRPMSSMTEEEIKEYQAITCCFIEKCECWNEVDWLNAHHFDYRGLIPKGLAIEALEGMLVYLMNY